VSNPTYRTRSRCLGIALAGCLAFAAVSTAAQAAPVNLATAGTFVALGGATVTNTGPSVLYGDLGVAPGTALVGFGLPAVVNGATHANDGVAQQAQADLTTAYTVAAGQPVSPANDLTGTDLGNRILTAGAYRFSSSAQLTGALTLDAQGDPNAQFVFLVGSALTTASGSSVVLINGASACNVFWQVGSSATLGTTTAFQGNLMALASISLNNAASVIGRLLARNGQISLINNVLDGSRCGTASGPTTPSTSNPGSGSTTGASTGASTGNNPGGSRRTVTRDGTTTLRRSPGEACTDGFHARVTGHLIKRVVFRLDGKRFATRTRAPFRAFVRAAAGSHKVSVRVTFKDATRAKTLTLPYRACADVVLRPRRGPSTFTG